VCVLAISALAFLVTDSATHCNTLQRTATHCNSLQLTATHHNTLQRIATQIEKLPADLAFFDGACEKGLGEMLQMHHTATHCCNTLQHTTHCSTLQLVLQV